MLVTVARMDLIRYENNAYPCYNNWMSCRLLNSRLNRSPMLNLSRRRDLFRNTSTRSVKTVVNIVSVLMIP